ncbi:TonB-dependent receptor [Novosphingobium resinovorum]|uniref:TonB-dependent receptor n=1 Tax=Novosphingobium resinovorum TaxID=158500 RepID=A0A1D7ZZP5_9SPHN|nr:MULTISPECIES: TonB-dependent receptor [Sphingomonadaceae]AOR75343.1 TonB-dependent receptor [Novosphingobium resinovorum]EJU14070.1 TonB-dependent receptor [Sphingomonas sp. LH128]MBF7010640.1 TonB-dependent receptor [Novosphingobium sp. HR1a]WJM28638.1 TonB-dependent receptor [Novosphingobium resinovorum]
MKIQRHWLATTAFALLAPACLSTAAQAAEAAPDAVADAAEGGGLGEIVVTAQKRRENLQETPISISVMRSDDLTNRHVTSLVDLGDGAIPSLKVAPFYSRNSALIVNIRGIGVLSDGNQPARDQGVGVYIDGVYLGRAQGLGTALFDIENVEVLKGPQGTLFGRNTEGGAVNIVTKKPSGEFHVNATGGVGNFGMYKGEVHVDLPSIANIAFKIDGVVARRDPLVKNPQQGQAGFNQYDKQGLHLEALWKPSPDFSADYSFDTSKDESTSLYLNLLAAGTNTQAALGTVQPDRVKTANVGVPMQPSVGKVHGHRLTLEWTATPDLTIKSISSYRKLYQDQWDNGSASTTMSLSPSALAAKGAAGFTGTQFARYSLALFNQNQWSQEVQAIGEVGRVKYVAGALYYREHVSDNAQAFYTNQFTNAAGSAYVLRQIDYGAQAIDRESHVTTRSVGAFGQATWTPAVMNDAIHLTGGLRWTKDMKHGALTIVNNALPINRDGVSGPIGLDASWSRVDPMVNLAVDLSQDVHVYGKWSTGYKSGGANSRSQNYDAFNPETVSIFEIGAKTEFFDHHARFNIAAYAGTYKDIQVDFQRPYETGGVRTTRTTTSTINAPGTGGLHGIEAELTVNPLAGLTLGASYSYQYVNIPATVNPYPNAAGVVSTVAVPIYQSYTPRHSASGTLDYELPMNGYTVRAHLDGNFDSGFYANVSDPVYTGPGAASNVYQPKGDKAFIVNGRLAVGDIAVGSGDAQLTFAVWARNLFNEQHVFYKALSPTSGLNGFFNEPRTFGGEMNIRF